MVNCNPSCETAQPEHVYWVMGLAAPRAASVLREHHLMDVWELVLDGRLHAIAFSI